MCLNYLMESVGACVYMLTGLYVFFFPLFLYSNGEIMEVRLLHLGK